MHFDYENAVSFSAEFRDAYKVQPVVVVVCIFLAAPAVCRCEKNDFSGAQLRVFSEKRVPDILDVCFISEPVEAGHAGCDESVFFYTENFPVYVDCGTGRRGGKGIFPVAGFRRMRRPRLSESAVAYGFETYARVPDLDQSTAFRRIKECKDRNVIVHEYYVLTGDQPGETQHAALAETVSYIIMKIV